MFEIMVLLVRPRTMVSHDFRSRATLMSAADVWMSPDAHYWFDSSDIALSLN
jgi:hypothetical protein